MGWMSERIYLRLPVAGGVFFLDIPFCRTTLHAVWLGEITIRHGHLHKEIRVENALPDESGNEMALEEDAKVEVTIEADPEAMKPKK